MHLTVWSEVLLLAALLARSAFFSSAETSLFSLSRLQLEQFKRDRDPRALLIHGLLAQPRRLIVTILIGNELVNVAASAVCAALIIDLWGAERKWLNLVVMVPVLLLFGEVTPKALAIRNNVAFARVQCRYLDWFARAVLPVRWVVRHAADFFTTLLTGSDRLPASIVTEDMLRSLAREAVGAGAIDPGEAAYIDHIFQFGDVTLRDIMTPRSQIFSLPQSCALRELAAEVTRTRHTKVPIYAQHGDAVVGVLFARDLLGVPLEGSTPEEERRLLGRLLHKPYFVPENKLAAELFHTFRRRRLSLAFTVDEYGGLTGMVTMEDLLECIFGDLPSQSERVKESAGDCVRTGSHEYRVAGALGLPRLAATLGVPLPAEGVETVAGFLLQEFRELPAEGAQIAVAGVTFVVTAVADRRIREVLVRVDPSVVPAAPPASDDPNEPLGG